LRTGGASVGAQRRCEQLRVRANFTKTGSLNLLYLVVLSRIPGGKVVPTFPECALGLSHSYCLANRGRFDSPGTGECGSRTWRPFRLTKSMSDEEPKPVAPIAQQAGTAPGTTPTRRAASFLFFFLIPLLIWLYALTKTFVFDIDDYIFSYLPNEFGWIITYRFFFLISLISATWIVVGNKLFFLFLAVILLFPIAIFILIPYFIIKSRSWLFAFAFINILTSSLKNGKQSFIIFTFYTISVTILLYSHDAILLYVTIFSMLLTIIVVYMRALLNSTKPTSVFQLYVKIFDWFRDNALEDDGTKKEGSLFILDQNIRGVPISDLDERQIQVWSHKLSFVVLYNSIGLFIANKLEDFQNSNVAVIQYILQILFIFIVSVLAFAAIHFALYKIDSSQYLSNNLLLFWSFFYFSFCNMVLYSIPGLVSVGQFSQLINMIQFLCSLILIGVFITVVMQIKHASSKVELRKIVERLKSNADDVQDFIRREYLLQSFDEAIAELRRLETGMIRIIMSILEEANRGRR